MLTVDLPREKREREREGSGKLIKANVCVCVCVRASNWLGGVQVSKFKSESLNAVGASGEKRATAVAQERWCK